MKFPKQIFKLKCPSHLWCAIFMGTFSFYCYRNIYLQSEIGYKLPSVDLIQALNNYNAFVTAPSTERFDMYVNLAKTFESYKDDYMEHYQEYTLMINNYLILSESQIALKYYAFKYYRNETYKYNDTYVLGSPIIEFNKNFNSPVELSTNREHNLVYKHQYGFGNKDNRVTCENFFNNYIYPLYKSQSTLREIEVAKSMSSILTHWIVIKHLQITAFICSLLLIFIFFICALIAEINPNLLTENKAYMYSLPIIYFLIYFAVFIVVFSCLSITLTTYHIDMNFNGLHNTSYNIIQLLLLIMMGYLSFCWVINFLNKYSKLAAKQNKNSKSSEEVDELKKQMIDFRKEIGLDNIETQKVDLETGAIDENTTNAQAENNIKNFLSATVKPFVDSMKRMVTPTAKASAVPTEFQGYIDENGPTMEDIQRIIHYTNNQSNINTSLTTNDNDNDRLDSICEEDEMDSKQKKLSLGEYSALNVVSAISLNNPDCSPFGISGIITAISDSKTNSIINTNSTSNSSNEFKFDMRSTNDYSKKILEEKKNEFYQHAGFALNKNGYTTYNSSNKASANNSENSCGSGKYYKKSPLSKLAVSANDSNYELNNINSFDLTTNNLDKNKFIPNTVSGLQTNVPWEKKFGLDSPGSDASTVQRSSSIKDRVSHFSTSSSKKDEMTASIQELKRNDTLKSNNIKTKNLKEGQTHNDQSPSKLRSDPQTLMQSSLSKEKEREALKNKIRHDFYLTSTGNKSELETSSAEVDEQDESASYSTENVDNQESVFSIDRMVREHNKR